MCVCVCVCVNTKLLPKYPINAFLYIYYYISFNLIPQYELYHVLKLFTL